MLILVLVIGRYGWMIWLAKDLKVTYRSVDQMDGEYTTVVIVRMQEYNAVSKTIVKFDVIDAWHSYVQVREHLRLWEMQHIVIIFFSIIANISLIEFVS